MGEAGDGLAPGIERSDEFTVAPPLVTNVGGTIGKGVLSTPGMIGMMEGSAQMLAYEHLPEGKATVGFEVCVKHVAGAGEGARCTVTARLDRVEDGRKFFFAVEVREGDRVLGVGTHQRRLVKAA